MELSPNPIIIPMSGNEQLLLALIAEELKSRRFFGTLQQLGFEDSHYQPHLDHLIMQGLGLDEANATFDFYFRTMDEHAAKLGIKEEETAAQAKEVFDKLKNIAL